jgi:flagellar motor component MotA
MPIRATLREDNTLELPEDAPRLARTGTPFQVIGLGSGTFVVTEKEAQIPQIASEFQRALKRANVTKEQLLDNLYEIKQEMAEEEGRA